MSFAAKPNRPGASDRAEQVTDRTLEVCVQRPLVVLQRGQILEDNAGWAPLKAGRVVVRRERVDFYLTVLVLEPEGAR